MFWIIHLSRYKGDGIKEKYLVACLVAFYRVNIKMSFNQRNWDIKRKKEQMTRKQQQRQRPHLSIFISSIKFKNSIPFI